MNYLAHSLLAKHDEELLLGNFIADHLRGNDLGKYSEGVQEGIRMHRKIDEFTDRHPLFKQSKRIFYDGFEKHSGILVDIYFDHLLARDFGSWSDTPLKEHSQKAYSVYQKNSTVLPETGGHFLGYVMQNDIYNAYSRPEGIERVLFHLSRRIRHGVALDQSMHLFRKNETALEKYFTDFFHEATEKFLVNSK